MAPKLGNPLPPNSVIGILGGGQLGRMTALAAARLGYRCHIFCPEADSPGSQVTQLLTRADYSDHEALSRFAAETAVITYEFENIDREAVRFLEQDCAAQVRPSSRVLEITQNRLLEKGFINSLKIETVEWRPIGTLAELQEAFAAMGCKIILKTALMGYDGKGQILIDRAEGPARIWTDFASKHPGIPTIAEKFSDFETEGSVIIARGRDGETAAYELVENLHQNHILSETRAMERFSPATQKQAQAIAATLAESLELVGLLAVEFFVRRDGSLLVNELAPRPHNSGHWTMDGAETSQFEQLIRAIVGLPLGSPRRMFDSVVMENLIGDAVLDWPQKLTLEPNARLHLYGKTVARAGRKMGHVNRLK
ncbi:MAG: 5-(carboxyamino)imidazole ribonucleotide synthase [Alphaproteobacteria bacterium]|nr:5-(carboxyamino)imidazole ribonucleotide synthase [Alphaproteobacteria bacterium]